MQFDKVRLLYPNEWRKVLDEIDCESFNWFLCSKRSLDPETKLYYISVSQKVQFFCEKTGKTSVVDSARLIILSDPHNKKRLCQMYECPVNCDSDRETLSTECELVVNDSHVKNIADKLVEIGFDGVVVKHDCIDKDLKKSGHPVCQNVTFYFKEGVIRNLGEDDSERCRIVSYSKRNNSRIRNVIREFPSCLEIDQMLEIYPCTEISKMLNDYIILYMKKNTA